MMESEGTRQVVYIVLPRIQGLERKTDKSRLCSKFGQVSRCSSGLLTPRTVLSFPQHGLFVQLSGRGFQVTRAQEALDGTQTRRPSILVFICVCEALDWGVMKHLQRVLPKAADCLNSSRKVEFKAQLLIRTLGFKSCDDLEGEKEHRF